MVWPGLRKGRLAALGTPTSWPVRIVRLYWKFASAYRSQIVVGLVALPVLVLVQNGLLPLIYSNVIDRLNQTHGHIPGLGLWVSGFLALHAVVFGAQRITNYLWSRTEHQTIRDMEQYIFGSLLRQSSHFHANAHGGGLVAQAKRFTGAFSSLTNAFYFNLYALGFRVVVAFGFLIVIAPVIAVILLLWTGIYLASILWLTKRKMHASAAAAAADSVMTARLADAIGNATVVKMFGTEATEGMDYAELSRDKYQKRRYDWRLSELTFAWQSLLMIGLEVAVLGLSIWLVQAGTFTIGKLALVQFFLAPILASLWQIAPVFRSVEAALADAAEMTDTLALEPEVKDAVRTEAAEITQGEIEFREVDFSYQGGRSLLQGFNLHIQPHEKIGLVGPSGSGKTSLTKLLVRFVDVQGGQILVDGLNIARLKQAELRQCMAFVPQEPQLFHRSIADNIRYARPEATDEEVVAAARQARAHDFIMKLPQGYDTLVGERGGKLSGGERQRIAIARAMLKDAPIVVLDEATSALDSESEQLIQEAFERLMHRRTAIVIAHRLSTVRNMDRIVVMKDGKVVEQGSHHELLEQPGLYNELWSHQAGV